VLIAHGLGSAGPHLEFLVVAVALLGVAALGARDRSMSRATTTSLAVGALVLGALAFAAG
jgi:hypothetical protein